MSDIERLEKVIALKADSTECFERMMGWRSGTVAALREKKEVSKDLLLEVVEKFCDISARWLLFGYGFIFGSPQKAVTQKLTFLANLERYIPVMNEEERQRYEDAVMIHDYTMYAVSRMSKWEELLARK